MPRGGRRTGKPRQGEPFTGGSAGGQPLDCD
jgi:hypothetical protein